MATNKILALLLVCLCSAAWSREAASPAACRAAAGQPAIADAKAALDADATDLRVRLKLADAWSDAGCFSEGLQVLQGGEALNPGNKELQARLRVANSLVSEQSYFDSMDRAAKGAVFSRAAFRCAKLADLNSCDDALSVQPTNPELLMGKADALVQLKRPGEAIVIYRSALGVSANREAVNARIALADAQRHNFLETCETKDGAVARRACESAWLPGAPDEVTVLKRRGLLLQADNQVAPALDAYMAAAHLDPGDRSVAQAIVSLSGGTGNQDAVTLAARARSLATLGRAPAAEHSVASSVKMPTSAPPKPVPANTAAANTAVANLGVANGRRYSNDAPAAQSN